MSRRSRRRRKRTSEEILEQIDAEVERAYQEARRKQYLLHLWEVNRPHYSETECITLIAPRAGYSRPGAVKALIAMGVISPDTPTEAGEEVEA